MSHSTPESVRALEDQLSDPTEDVVATLAALDGDLIFLGVGGKMGPTLARMAQRASELAGRTRRVIGVSRFSSDEARANLESCGVETIACDLLDADQVAQLPFVPNVVYMAGFKFGVTQDPARAWAMNCYVPSLICRQFRESQIVAFSTGNVYGLVDASGRGSRESDPLDPVGEYAVTALGRERMFEFFSRQLQIPTLMLRLNYATELRYGVLVDLALAVRDQQPIPLEIGYVNTIWQADANAMTLRALGEVGGSEGRGGDSDGNGGYEVLNLAGPQILSVRQVAETFGERMGRSPVFESTEGPVALLNDGRHAYTRLGTPRVTAEQMIEMTAEWIGRGGEILGKPTHFEAGDGKF